MTRRALLVGIGAGHPDQVTVEAVHALRRCDVFLVAAKDEEAATDDLVAVRSEILARHVGPDARVVEVPDPPRDRSEHATAEDYERAVEAWHDDRARAFGAAIESESAQDGTVGFLVWGDPAFYDSTIRVLERIVRGGADLDFEVVPGVGALSVLAARHRLVLNAVGSPVTVTTGRRLLETVAAGADNIVVMLDGSLTCSRLDLAAWDIWWGANLGTEAEALVSGPLQDRLPAIEQARSAVRAARGWVMDTYLLRRR